MATKISGCKALWIVYILVIYCAIPFVDAQCELPLIETENESFMNEDGCGLFCNNEEAATPWTDRKTNKNISIIFLAFLIPAFICNMIFTINNILEHQENEETFQTTPITYDALFVWYFLHYIIIHYTYIYIISHVQPFQKK